MKYCPNCGKENAGDTAFCSGCGASLAANTNQQAYNTYGPAPVITNRNIVLAIVFSFLTCGIYGIYWFVVMTDEINRVDGTPEDTSGLMAFVFSLITCGIYGIYWYYKMAKKLYSAGQKYGKSISDNGVLYIVLSLFGLGLVNYCIMQSDLNKFANQ